jgi:hypothetical protein
MFVHQQSVNLSTCLSTNNLSCLDHSPPGECLSTNTLTTMMPYINTPSQPRKSSPPSQPRECISTSPSLSLKYAKLYLGQRLRQNINCLLIGGDVLENHFSLMDFITDKINSDLDLNVLRPVMEQGGSLKASHNFDYHNISQSNPTPNQIVQKSAYEAILLPYKHHKLQYTLLLQCLVQHTYVSC